jgi:hypothetical protein
MLPQAQQAGNIFFWNFMGAAGIVVVIFGFVGEMPQGC